MAARRDLKLWLKRVEIISGSNIIGSRAIVVFPPLRAPVDFCARSSSVAESHSLLSIIMPCARY